MNENIDKIKKELDRSTSILLHCHPSPDPDSVGSALAMKLALEQMGKKVTLIKGDSDIPASFAFPGIETIIQKNFFEIDLKDFDLFVILDSGSVEMISSKDKVVFPDHLMTIVIDHHASNKGYGKINLIDSSYPATAQLLFDLFKEINIRIDHDIALNLFMGIFTDTGGFRYENTSLNTFKVATELVALASDYTKTIHIMDNSKRKEALIAEGILLSSVKTFFGEKLAIVSISSEEIIKNNLREEDINTGHMSSKLKSVLGTCIAVTLVEIRPAFIKVSFRTSDSSKYDVSKIAVSLGGGGHVAAAGVKMQGSLSEAMDKVAKTAKELYNL